MCVSERLFVSCHVAFFGERRLLLLGSVPVSVGRPTNSLLTSPPPSLKLLPQSTSFPQSSCLPM